VASYNLINGIAQFNAAAGTDYIIGFAISGGQIRILQNRAILNTYAGTWNGPFYLWLGHITGSQAGGTDVSDLRADWVLVRKFVTPEPLVSSGVEESPTLYPLISGIDISTGMATDSNSGISNGIRILRQNIALSSDVLDLGTIACGEIGSSGNTNVINTGNAALVMVRWESRDLESSEGFIIDKANLTFFPDPVGPIPLGGLTQASLTLSIPFAQTSGTYIATMAVYDDSNGNLWRDLGATGEPVDYFSVRVVVPSSKKIRVVDDLIDLGNWEIGMTTSAMPTQAFNAGNLPLSNLQFKQIVGSNSFPISVSPGALSLATGAFMFADVIATLTVGPPGNYIATWTLWSDENGNNLIDAGEASDSFQIRVGAGLAGLTITPAAIDFGICSHTITVSQQVALMNTGQVSLDNLRTSLYALYDGSGNVIATSQVSLTLPSIVSPGITHPATASLYIPSGTAAGTYSGTQLVFEDRNANGLPDADEASATLSLTVTVPSLRRVEVFLDNVDMGSIIPGTIKTLTLDARNIGNTELPMLRWEKSNLLDGPKVYSALNASFPTSEPFYVATGAFFSREIQLAVPLMQASGSYFSTAPHFWLFNDDNLDTIRSASEPEDTFTVKCQIGLWTIDILETTLNSSGDPSLHSSNTSFFVKNIGELAVFNAKATASALIPAIAGPPDISAQANIVSPTVIGGISAGQTKSVTWQVLIPNGCIAGNYTGTLTIWDDRNGNDLLDVDEVSDTVNLILTVNSRKVIKVMQNPLNLGWTLSGTTVQGAFEIVNVGNLDLTSVTPLASSISNMGNTIPAGNISFSPGSLGLMAVGTARIATVTVAVGWPRADGTYRGNQRIFDDYSGADGLYSANEESCLFELMVSIGYKKLSITNPVAFGTRNPGQIVTQACSIKNETTVPLTAVKWLKGQLESGSSIIPVASLTFVPAGPIGIGGSNNRACSVYIALDASTPPGNYIGTHSVWEDNNGDGIIQASEASATFNTTLTVAALPALDILSGSINAGQIAAGSTSPWIEVMFINTGNVSLTSAELNWHFNAMHDVLGNSLAAGAVTASTTLLPDPLPPNQTGRAFFRIGPIPANQVPGLYFGGPQTLSNGGTASDFCEFACEIIPGGPINLPPGTVIQAIATTTFPAPAQRYFFSAYVCPASGAAKISLLGRDEADANTTQAFGMELKSDLTLTTFGSGIHRAEILETIPPDATSVFPWHRIFFSFDFAFDPLLASHTYLSLQNSSPTTASHSVWFDGIQFERSVFPDQIRPTSYNPGKKIVSPNKGLSLSGDKLYMEY